MAIPFKNIQAIVQITHEIMHGGQYADKAFEAHFKSHKSFSDSDVGFIVQEVYYLVRNWRLINDIQGKADLGMPNDGKELLAIGWVLANKSLSDLGMDNRVKRNSILEIFNSIKGNRAILNSIPDWLDDLGSSELGGQWPAILQALNHEPPLVIRTNTLKCSRDKLYNELLGQGIKTRKHDKAVDALIFSNKLNVFKLPVFKLGLFEMQDISSQLTGHFANPLPGMRVVDGCAGNGGKTLHLGSLMQNKGRIIALDIFPGKLETLKSRAKRAGISIIEMRVIDSTKVIKRLHGSADLVLLDVPCSGLGVLNRNPEIKWRLQPDDLESLRKTQEDILNRYSLMVRPGGKLVYSTCSILPSENSIQIQKFMEKNKEAFEFVKERFISPEEGFDGFYMAMLSRKQ